MSPLNFILEILNSVERAQIDGFELGLVSYEELEGEIWDQVRPLEKSYVPQSDNSKIPIYNVEINGYKLQIVPNRYLKDHTLKVVMGEYEQLFNLKEQNTESKND